MADTEEKKDCRKCKHSGWDPDGPYCVAPAVLEKGHKYGLVLSSMKLTEICPAPTLPKFEPRPVEESDD